MQFPILLQRDDRTSCISCFSLGDHQVVGFVVGQRAASAFSASFRAFAGGEPRLCLPQLQALILPERVDVDRLLAAIHATTIAASAEQLAQLQQAAALPPSAGYCPLISRSNAEKLVSHCVISGVRPLRGVGNVDTRLDDAQRRELQSEQVKVAARACFFAHIRSRLQLEHFCFGGSRANFYPTLLGGACLECNDCDRLFTPSECERTLFFV